MKNLEDIIKESKQVQYRAQIGVKDSEGTFVNITIGVDKSNVKEVEEWFKQEQDNIFHHVSGGNVEY